MEDASKLLRFIYFLETLAPNLTSWWWWILLHLT